VRLISVHYENVSVSMSETKLKHGMKLIFSLFKAPQKLLIRLIIFSQNLRVYFNFIDEVMPMCY
jgi:hypothetical protein